MHTATTFKPQDGIAVELAAIVGSASHSWIRIGTLLDQVDREGYWRDEASSFTEWVKSLAARLNLKEGSVWRMLTSARFYIQLQIDLSSRGIFAPRLNELDDSVSPEKLELLEKLRRVADTNVTDPISLQVIDGSITRSALRSTWEAYRPILDGRTARGRGVDVPRIDETDSRQFVSLLDAQVMIALQASGPKWTGVTNPKIYKLFTNVRPQFNSTDRKIFEFDIVAIVRESSTSPLIFHGIEIRGHHLLENFPSSVAEFRSMAEPFCDFFWLATNELGAKQLHNDMGLLTVTISGVGVRRSENRSLAAGSRTGDLAKGLLIKAMKN